MATIDLKSGAVVTVTTTLASMATGSAASAGTCDFRTAGTTNLIEKLQAVIELTCQWSTVTGIVAGTLVADLYLVPRNFADTADVDIDATAGASYIASQYRCGSVSAPKAPTASTDMVFQTRPFDVDPRKFSLYVLNRSGQTISVNGDVKILATDAQSA